MVICASIFHAKIHRKFEEGQIYEIEYFTLDSTCVILSNKILVSTRCRRLVRRHVTPNRVRIPIFVSLSLPTVEITLGSRELLGSFELRNTASAAWELYVVVVVLFVVSRGYRSVAVAGVGVGAVRWRPRGIGTTATALCVAAIRP